MDINIEERVEKAVELFRQGYNCSQSVVAAYADIYGFTTEQSLKMAASFGAGIGRMRETCGAACGMFLLAGLQTGCTDPKDNAGKDAPAFALEQTANTQSGVGHQIVQQHGLPAPGIGTVKKKLQKAKGEGSG